MKTGTKQNAERVNVLDLRDSPWVDGPGRTILDCARSIEGEKYHFIIGSFSGGEQKTNTYVDEAKRRGLEVVSIPEKRSFDWQVIPFILEVIKQNNISLIHTHDFRSDVFGLICAKRCGIPVISTVHGWIANDTKGKIYCKLDKFFLRFFDHIVAVSTRTRELVENAFISKNKTTVINNALILDHYKISRDEQDFRKELGVSSSKKLIANIGRLSPEKGQLEFLQAAQEILKTRDDAIFMLIGVGPDEEKLREFSANAKIEQHVVFAGYRKDMVSIYNSVDLVVQSSYTEGMPNVVLEALLMEVPVIATDVGGTGEIITSGSTGMLIKPGSVKELVDEINNYLDNPDKYTAIVKKGRNLILEDYNHSKRAEKIARLYDRLLES